MTALALMLALLGTSVVADATPPLPPAPAARPVSGDTAQMNVPFALDFFNVRIQKIEWMADSAPLIRTMGLSDSSDGTGTLVITAAVKANGHDSQNLPTSDAQAIFKDGSASTQEQLDAYTPSGRRSNATYQAGDGGTVLFILINVPPPSADNPITKIVFRQSYEGLKPALIRLLNPPVSVVK